MTDPKLCRDCRWAVNLFPDDAEAPRRWDWNCGHPEALVERAPDYVMGQPVAPRQDRCMAVRHDLERCGPEGRWWEPAGDAGFGPP